MPIVDLYRADGWTGIEEDAPESGRDSRPVGLRHGGKRCPAGRYASSSPVASRPDWKGVFTTASRTTGRLEAGGAS